MRCGAMAVPDDLPTFAATPAFLKRDPKIDRGSKGGANGEEADDGAGWKGAKSLVGVRSLSSASATEKKQVLIRGLTTGAFGGQGGVLLPERSRRLPLRRAFLQGSLRRATRCSFRGDVCCTGTPPHEAASTDVDEPSRCWVRLV